MLGCYFPRIAACLFIRMKYLASYPEPVRHKVQELIDRNGLADVLRQRYQAAHQIRTDKALYQYVQVLKNTYLRQAPAIDKVAFDSKIHVIQHALGLHTSISRVQGGKLKAKHEIRVANIFKQVPEEFLRMIVVHELAHLKEKQHDKAFYLLCQHMEGQYHQFEFDLRLYLTWLDLGGEKLWAC